jgi:Reverse transcriptase (RNA-dependent DNA polymerase)
MAIKKETALFAIRNIAQYGDTDVFPYPLENHWFHDREDNVANLLMSIDKDFEGWLKSYPLNYSTGLASVGYHGFRAATQIDPIWNAYLLALLLEIGEDLERARITPAKERVFSYRFKPSPDKNSIFDRDIGWLQFQQRALKLSRDFEYVVSTDISDFYPRIYHHRLENALRQATQNVEAIKRVMEISRRLSIGETSYGLPVGGQASRMLAELLLNRTDRLLNAAGITFCRFVDDYYLFANDTSSAQVALVQLSEILLANEGLTLARSKTRVLTKSEFSRVSPIAEIQEGDTADEEITKEFLGFRLAFDPYSPTADEDYSKLRDQLSRFDITGMLARELKKSRIDESLTRHLIKSMRFLEVELRNAAIQSIIQNLNLLYPIFPTIAILLRQTLPDISEDVQSIVFDKLRSLIRSKSHIMLVPANLCYAIRILGSDRSEDTDALLIEVYSEPTSNMMIKRDILLAMVRRGVDYWLSSRLKQFATVTAWEKRALIVASYILSDEGAHWRRRIKDELSSADEAFLEWTAEKFNGRSWEIPF